jgi:CHASE3 domain sensor protein
MIYPRRQLKEPEDLYSSAMKSLGWRKKISFALAALSLAVSFLYVLFLQKTINQHRDLSASLLNLDRMEEALYRMEGANNGFLLTGESDFRLPFVRQRDIVSFNYKELVAFTSGDSVQQERLKNFKAKLTRWFALYNPIIVRRRALLDSPAPQDETNDIQQKNLRKGKLVFEEMIALLDEVRSNQEYKANHWEPSDDA